MPDCGRQRLDIGDGRELVRGMDIPVRPTEATEKDLTPARRLDEAHIGARRGAPAPELAWREAEAGAERMLPARPMRAVVRVDDRGEMDNHLGLYRDWRHRRLQSRAKSRLRLLSCRRRLDRSDDRRGE